MIREWMKIELNTPNKRQVFAMARHLKKSTNEILGACVRLWCWCDANCTDGNTGMDAASLDEVVCLKGFVRAMASVGWCELVQADGVETVMIARFDEHNGATAKKRAETNRRVAKHRKNGNAKETQEQQECNTYGVTSALPKALPELEQEYNNKGVCKATLQGEAKNGHFATRQQAPAPLQGEEKQRFASWLAAVAEAHPSVSKSRVLAPDVEAAARAAFERCPQAAEYAALLRAYFADSRLQEDKNRKPYWRPTRQADYFINLEDLICHAERWDKEAGWSKQRRKVAQNGRRTHESASSASLNGESGKVCSPTETRAHIDDMKRELGMEVEP